MHGKFDMHYAGHVESNQLDNQIVNIEIHRAGYYPWSDTNDSLKVQADM